MKKLFKTSSRNHPAAHEGDADHHLPSDAPSPTKSPSKSGSSRPPSGSSSSRKSSSQASPARKEHRSKSSRTFVRQSTDPGHSSRRSRTIPDTHPLNLPPDERRRLSALSNMSDPSAMDVDPPSSPSTSSPPQQAQPQPQSAFSVPITNGTKHANGGSAPPVPPHRSNPTSPSPTPLEEAEAFKAAGNKYFKEKNYADAIKQYDKGKMSQLRSLGPRSALPNLPLDASELCKLIYPFPISDQFGPRVFNLPK